jgi:YVTN family beta-propeller protein
MRNGGWWIGLTVVTLGAAGAWTAQRSTERAAETAVGDPSIRRSGLTSGKTLLFNGWGVTPVGKQTPISDLPLKMVHSPDGKTLCIVSGGFNRTGVTLFDVATQRQTQFVPLPRAFNGIAFNREGTRLFFSGGAGGAVHAFDFAGGRLGPVQSTTLGEATSFVTGLAVHPTSGKLYVLNEGNREIWVVDPVAMKVETTLPVGQHPHSAVFGADRRHLYISNWGGRSVSVLDSQTGKRVREFNVGLRPNDMTLGPDGRLFVACSGDNTVHVIQTRALETPEAPADPTRRPP